MRPHTYATWHGRTCIRDQLDSLLDEAVEKQLTLPAVPGRRAPSKLRFGDGPGSPLADPRSASRSVGDEAQHRHRARAEPLGGLRQRQFVAFRHLAGPVPRRLRASLEAFRDSTMPTRPSQIATSRRSKPGLAAPPRDRPRFSSITAGSAHPNLRAR